MRTCLLALIALVMPALANAEPILKIINFTADWCPNCRILNPELDAALQEFPSGSIKLVKLDMTYAGRSASADQKNEAFANAINTANSHQAGYLWDWYGGVTGIAVIISADNGEPISCVNRSHDMAAIVAYLREADIISRRRPPGLRMPEGADCPPARY